MNDDRYERFTEDGAAAGAALSSFAQAAGITQVQLEELQRAMKEQFEDAVDRSGPITFTNRAARRARAKSERKNA